MYVSLRLNLQPLEDLNYKHYLNQTPISIAPLIFGTYRTDVSINPWDTTNNYYVIFLP